jgi:signal transduction histidine kinase
MLRNREFRLFLWALAILAAAGAAVGFIISPAAAAACTGTALLIIGAAVGFTVWRYRKIARLSSLLRRINGGDHSLDPRDEAEGELSILKSELYKTTVMLREQNERLQRDKTALTQLLTDVSHQLKTPLTSLFVMTDLLSDPKLPEERRAEFIPHIQAQLERLQWLVNALLKLSRLDAGTVQFQSEDVPGEELLKRAIAPLLIPMELKSQSLHMNTGSVRLRCDPHWTAEALLNIAKNCMEHMQEGGDLTLICSQNPLYTQITVKDTGPGIDPEDLPHIWDRFYRGKNAREDSVGVGLALAASIVQGQDGSVSAHLPPEGGTAFEIRFPK